MRNLSVSLVVISCLVALFSSIDTVGAMDGTHITFSWIWWAVALIFLQLTPARAVQTRQEQIEAAFFLAAKEYKEELKVECAKALDAIEESVIAMDVELARVLIAPKTLAEIERGLAFKGFGAMFLPPTGTSPLRSRTLHTGRAPGFLAPSLNLV